MYVADIYTKLLLYVIPVPVAILVIRNGVRTGVLATLVAALGVGAILGPIDGLIVLVRVGFIGIALGALLARKRPWVISLAGTSVASLAAFVSDFLLASWASGLSPGAMIVKVQEGLTEAGQRTMELYQKIGVPEESLGLVKQMMELMPVWLKTFLPSVLVIGAVFSAAIAYAATRWILLRMKRDVQPIPPFADWRIDWRFAWGLIGALVLAYAVPGANLGLVRSVTTNAVVVYVMVYSVFGIAVLWSLLGSMNVPKGFRIIIALFIYMTPPLNWLLPMAGMLDGWLDFRKLASRA
jgi:uncharacterized protein YybS (DUF2232 family)